MAKIDYNTCPVYLTQYLQYLQTIKGRSPRTVMGYYVDIRYFLRYLSATKLMDDIILTPDNLKKIPIRDIQISFIENVTLFDAYGFLTFVIEDGNNSSTKTQARKVSSIKGFYKYLHQKANLISKNPLEMLEAPSVKKSLPRYLTLDQSLTLFDTLSENASDRDYCIFVLFMNCGMRISELVNINISDIKDNTVRLLGKGNKERIIYLNEACLSAIEKYLKERPVPEKSSDKDALFLSRNKKRISVRRVEQIVDRYLKLAGFEDGGYSPHKLRHTAATLMYQHGNVDIRTLKEILGHANIGTTEIYTHVSNKQLEKAADASPLANVKKKVK